ncbi:hypothetical protein [Streptomyces sp. 1222.5]|uniref:hypothetical protein n=1 Tax=Streptomyces sp. 1222.5 TaxID=1881026 RepID=UPI003EBD7E15
MIAAAVVAAVIGAISISQVQDGNDPVPAPQGVWGPQVTFRDAHESSHCLFPGLTYADGRMRPEFKQCHATSAESHHWQIDNSNINGYNFIRNTETGLCLTKLSNTLPADKQITLRGCAWGKDQLWKHDYYDSAWSGRPVSTEVPNPQGGRAGKQRGYWFQSAVDSYFMTRNGNQVVASKTFKIEDWDNYWAIVKVG